MSKRKKMAAKRDNTTFRMKTKLDTIQQAITNFQVIQLKYLNREGVVSEREIEPLALYFEQGEWCLIAFCRLRQEKRLFLLNRVDSMVQKAEPFAPNQFSLASYFKQQ